MLRYEPFKYNKFNVKWKKYMSRKNSKLETKSFLQKERILPNIFH